MERKIEGRRRERRNKQLLDAHAETNSTPFDFAEGESELVSGFNVECGGGGFGLIFLAE